jgi:hypothetical protein
MKTILHILVHPCFRPSVKPALSLVPLWQNTVTSNYSCAFATSHINGGNRHSKPADTSDNKIQQKLSVAVVDDAAETATKAATLIAYYIREHQLQNTNSMDITIHDQEQYEL